MHSDYILRLIEQFVAALIRITNARKFGNSSEALQLIQESSNRYLNKDLSILIASSPEQLEAFFSTQKATDGATGKQIDSDRCLICAELLFETAMLLNETEHTNVALRAKALSLHLYALALSTDKSLQVEKYQAKMTQILAEISEKELPEASKHILASYRK